VGLGSVFNALVLFTLLKKRGWYAPGSGWLVYVLRVLAASVAMIAFLFWIQTGLDWSAMQAQWLHRLVLVAGVILGAAVTYFAVLAVLGWRARELRGAD
jgi:putative peptidoglycan lipid II flippase